MGDKTTLVILFILIGIILIVIGIIKSGIIEKIKEKVFKDLNR